MIWSSVGQIDNSCRRVVHLLTAKGGSSGQYTENFDFSACKFG